MLETIIPILKVLYWPAWYAGIAICAFTVLLTIYFGISAMFRGYRAPAPESRTVALLGWLGILCLAITIGPVIPYMAFAPVSGLTDFLRDEHGRAVGLSILGGVRVIAGDNQSYWRWWGECAAILMLGGRGLCFAVMMWPSPPPRRGRTVLSKILEAPGTKIDRGNGSQPLK